MRCLNTSFKMRCLQCSFGDKEVGEYIQFKKKARKLPKKFALDKVGKQDDGSWAFGPNVQLSSAGEIIDSTEQLYIWIGDLYRGPGVAPASAACSIELPLSIHPLNVMLVQLRQIMSHNFMPCVLTLASTIMGLHYETMLEELNFCPVPLSFGSSGTGKTTALLCGLSLIGAKESRFYSKITKEKILDLCSNSCIPLAVDDPQSKGDISRLLIDLYNGARSGTITHGGRKPLSTCLIAANFTTDDQTK